jgi:ubiquinone biosynthesis protein
MPLPNPYSSAAPVRHRNGNDQRDDPPDPESSSVVGRSARLLNFVGKYRRLAASPGGADDGREGPAAEELVRDVERLGPAFIKIGQALSIRPDLLPPRYLDALQRLQDDVEAVPFETIRERVEAELGVKVSSAFEHFDPTPLAAASLAQVHAATLRDGREVVVKVQRPGIREAIRADLAVLRGLARGADRLTEQGRRMHFADWIDEMSETLDEELDYRLEADNLRVFAERLADYPSLSVPAPVDDFCSARVLTMQRMPGTKVSVAVELRRLEQPLGELADALISAYLEQIFLHGLVHADPHPGNVLLSDAGLALIDLGMVVRLGPRMRDRLLKLLAAMVDGNGEEVASQTAEISERLEMFDARQWNRRCSRLVARFHTRSSRDAPSEGRLMVEITRLAVACGLRPPQEVAVLGRTLLALDAVTRLLDPQRTPRELVSRKIDAVMAKRAQQQVSLQSLKLQVAEVAELTRDLPRQANAVLSMLAQNRFRVHISGLEESRLLENMQKIANRITAGLISAALVVGAALALRVDAGPRLLGYPGVALVLFCLAFALSGLLIVNVALSDRHLSRYRARRR